MKREDINIRDPYVLVSGGKYYLYGTRSATTWEPVGGLDVYVSEDLEDFEGPIEILPAEDHNYWAPECYEKNGKFYLLVTMLTEGEKKGVYVLSADAPVGPFTLCSKRLTPEKWTCIDGTLYWEKDEPYLVYSHTFEDAMDPNVSAESSLEGDYCIQKLSADLSEAVTDPVVLFKAKDCVWAKPIPFAKMEFGIEEDVYFSDGPCIMKLSDGRLYMINSSWSLAGYAVGVAVSENGVMGPWQLQEEPLYPVNGGHGMFFEDKKGELTFALHYPNDKFAERPVFYRVKFTDGKLVLGDQI